MTNVNLLTIDIDFRFLLGWRIGGGGEQENKIPHEVKTFPKKGLQTFHKNHCLGLAQKQLHQIN